jgi:HlyD family secretion protein
MDRRVVRPHARRQRMLIYAGAAAVVVAALVVWVLLAPPSNAVSVQRDRIDTAVVQRAPFQDYLPVRAQVAPLQTVFLGAVSGGQVDQVLVADGSEVTAGQVLATLSNPQLKLDVTSREAVIAGQLGDVSAQQLALTRNRIDQQQAIAETSYDLLKANRDLDIRQHLHAQGFESEAGVKTFADDAAYYAARLKALKAAQVQEDAIAARQAAQIDQTGGRLRSNLGVVESSLDALQVRAPVAGQLTNFTLQPGQSLKAGDQVGQIDGEGAYKIVADVDEFYLGRVAPGQSAGADIDGSTYALTISHVLPQVTDGRFRAELTFRGKAAPALHRGEAVDVRITLGDTRPALVAPNGAWLESGGGTVAFVIQPGGRRADRRAVTVGRRNPEQVEITSGLAPGETIVTSSYSGFETYAHLMLH